jgi:hypothetical protein
MTMHYVVYQQTMMSTHYDLALSGMGLAGENAPNVLAPPLSA